jgi:hypothetical protein
LKGADARPRTHLRGRHALAVLSERITKLYEEANTAVTAQEAKASTILGFVGGGAGLYALAVEAKAAAHPAFSWLLATGILFLVSTLVGTLLCLAGRPRRGMDVLRDEFTDPETLNDPATTKARIIGYLFITMVDRYDAYRKINLAKGYFIELAQELFAFGVIALVANYGVSALAGPAKAKPTAINCTLPAAAAKPASVDCTITAGSP